MLKLIRKRGLSTCSMKFVYHFLIIISLLFQTACGPFKYKKVDAREVSPDPKERVKKNIEEGRGFRIMGGTIGKGGTFDFASSNPLWKASLDILDFMPLTTANYSGGIIISDWYSENNNQNEFIKISVRFLTNEIRSDALNVKIFLKQCSNNQTNCKITENNNELVAKLKLNILKKAARYEKEAIEKNKKENPYVGIESKGGDVPKENEN